MLPRFRHPVLSDNDTGSCGADVVTWVSDGGYKRRGLRKPGPYTWSEGVRGGSLEQLASLSMKSTTLLVLVMLSSSVFFSIGKFAWG